MKCDIFYPQMAPQFFKAAVK